MVLKNAYRNFDSNNLMVNHEHILQTADGFLLSMNLTDKIKIPQNKIFEAIYISELDKNSSAMINNQIEIDLNHNSIKNYRKNYLLPPMIKPLLATHNVENSLFYGNNVNNKFISIKNNSYVNFSHDIDTYIIDNLEIKGFSNNKSIIFYFKEIIAGYTHKYVIIAIKNYSGYDFYFMRISYYIVKITIQLKLYLLIIQIIFLIKSILLIKIMKVLILNIEIVLIVLNLQLKCLLLLNMMIILIISKVIYSKEKLIH
ncbi:hypothetical protein [Arsenophonus endosymbiont of Aleurodicus floccissimus]|uniref:hypothetical protein n=1 Tax=Arsenophonus endosymbiont of Aleurodicus floccissimus TaxID=2152761 RepID=UPI000E6AEB2C|nr:hypothetical protein [Arsenophonus endosymbiont of Aleurodicus floccissimus]